jgi:predicted aspartyl protease
MGSRLVKTSKTYRLTRFGNLLRTKVTPGSSDGLHGQAQLLVDTGASYTILPAEVIVGLGYDLQQSQRVARFVSVSGIVIAPVVVVAWFNCLGQTIKEFPIVAHTIPSGIYFDGLLGMDFLTQCKAVISVAEAKIQFSKSKL